MNWSLMLCSKDGWVSLELRRPSRRGHVENVAGVRLEGEEGLRNSSRRLVFVVNPSPSFVKLYRAVMWSAIKRKCIRLKVILHCENLYSNGRKKKPWEATEKCCTKWSALCCVSDSRITSAFSRLIDMKPALKQRRKKKPVPRRDPNPKTSIPSYNGDRYNTSYRCARRPPGHGWIRTMNRTKHLWLCLFLQEGSWLTLSPSPSKSDQKMVCRVKAVLSTGKGSVPPPLSQPVVTRSLPDDP